MRGFRLGDMYMLNRTVCDVLAEMRKCYETRNFCSLLGLIEEAQGMVNRMESALYDQSDLRHAEKKLKELKKELKVLEAQKDFLEELPDKKS